METLILGFIRFLNTAIVPFLIALAFIVFLWNIVRYFIIGGANEQEHEKAKNTALYGIAAFVLIACIWGIVNLLIYGFGFTNNQPIVPDYIQRGASGGGGGGGGSSANYPYGSIDGMGNDVQVYDDWGSNANLSNNVDNTQVYDDWGSNANLSNTVDNTQVYDDWGSGANLANDPYAGVVIE